MSNPITPELRAKILSSIKDDGISVADASASYGFTEDTIKKWLRGSAENSSGSSSEVLRLKKENQILKELIGNLLLEKELKKKNFTRS